LEEESSEATAVMDPPFANGLVARAATELVWLFEEQRGDQRNNQPGTKDMEGLAQSHDIGLLTDGPTDRDNCSPEPAQDTTER
jgi:hypothetical protein